MEQIQEPKVYTKAVVIAALEAIPEEDILRLEFEHPEMDIQGNIGHMLSLRIVHISAAELEYGLMAKRDTLQEELNRVNDELSKLKPSGGKIGGA